MIRSAVFALCVPATIGCLGEMCYGPRRKMFWSQWLRYLSLVILLVTVMGRQYNLVHTPITSYTVAFGVGALIGSLGVWPRLKKPMLSRFRPVPTRDLRDARPRT